MATRQARKAHSNAIACDLLLTFPPRSSIPTITNQSRKQAPLQIIDSILVLNPVRLWVVSCINTQKHALIRVTNHYTYSS